MDAFAAHAAATSLVCLVQAIPLLFTPGLIITILSPEVREPTSLEIYFARSLALALFCISGVSVVLSGLIPLQTAGPASATLDDSAVGKPSPYATLTTTMLALHHGAVAFYMYGAYGALGSFGFAAGGMGAAGLAAWGVWCVLFGEGGRRSKRTGADKRVSGWPFGNAEAEKKKEGRRRKL